MAELSTGDRVSWHTPQGVTHGKIVEHKTGHFTFDGQNFNASVDDPYVIVESEKSGKRAAHKLSSVTKS